MTNYFTIPGLGNSGPEHWQTYFEKALPRCNRIEQDNWENPVCRDWIDSIENTVLEYDPKTVVLIAHSLGCTAIAHWSAIYKHKIKGAILVAPSDIEAPQYKFNTSGFKPLPLEKLNFPSLLVASANDPWVSMERAHFFANHWGCDFKNIGNAGHINSGSGFGNWEKGIELVTSFKDKCSAQ